ncbi:MAG: SH3 domain-containing protein, partial [Lachnospiraceae bacterium]|nr:SH3 domain-containing protein [Lachnospiraceae bacterium]
MMDKQSAKKLLVIVAVFYVATAVLAVCILNLSGSIFAGRGDMDMLGYLKNMRGGDDKLVTDETESVEGSVKVEGLEALGSDEKSAVSEDTVYEEAATEPATEEASEETVVTEPASEPLEEEPVEAKHYYSFKTNNTDSILRMREGPGEEYRVIYELKPGSTGYVKELGDEWSKVIASGVEGYCSNEYLTMTEITEDAYNELVELAEGSGTEGGTAGGTDTQQTGTAQT